MFDRARLDPDWWEDRAPAHAGLPTEFHDDDPRVVGADLGLLPEARALDDPPQHEDFAALATALRQVQGADAHVRLATTAAAGARSSSISPSTSSSTWR